MSALRRRGLTLVEMLVSVTLTLLLVLAVVQIFQALGDTISSGRATIEISGQLRNVASNLQDHLDTVTSPMTPPVKAESGAGYFYYEEGPANDASLLVDGTSSTASDGEWDSNLLTHYGDVDDILAMTIKSKGKPFKGKVWVQNTNLGTFRQFTVESDVAEVVWWVATLDVDSSGTADPNEPRMLLRRTFLVLPTLNLPADRVLIDPQILVDVGGPVNVPTAAFWSTDLSLRKPINDVNLRLNTLSDLSDPRSRSFAFYGSEHQVISGPVRMRHPALTSSSPPISWIGFPRIIQPDDNLAPPIPGPGPFAGDTDPGDMGEFAAYVVIQDLLAFDVRAFDADAPLLQFSTDPSAPIIAPSDPAFFSSALGGPAGIRQAFLGTISNNDALIDLSGFESLSSLGNYLNIANNDELITLSGLEGLTSIGGNLNIASNSKLVDISALEMIDPTTIVSNTSASEDIEIYGNDLLSTCENLAICLAMDAGKTSNINNNAVGCNSQQEVEVACASSILPVEWLEALKVRKEKSGHLLTFATAQEVNNDMFILERSSDGKHFDEIHNIKGKGNFSKESHYSILDESPLQGMNYYRVKQVDFDAQFSYSNIAVIDNSKFDSQIQIYPNPASSALNILNTNEEIEVTIYNYQGGLVRKINLVQGRNIIELDDFQKGIYFIKPIHGIASKIIVQ